MTQVLRGNIVHAPAMGRLDILEHGCLVLEDGVITGLYQHIKKNNIFAKKRIENLLFV